MSKNLPNNLSPVYNKMMECQKKSMCVEKDLDKCKKEALKGKEKEMQTWENDDKNKDAMKESTTKIADCLKKL